MEPCDEDAEEKWLYQITQEDKDEIKLNTTGEILHGSSLSIGHNSYIKLYEWKMENYELEGKKCCSI